MLPEGILCCQTLQVGKYKSDDSELEYNNTSEAADAMGGNKWIL